jgi:phosphoesterase RecJ-like protein
MAPDGDTLGSAIAMKVLLRAFGHRVLHVCPDPPPERYGFLPGADEVVTELPADLPPDAGVVTLDAADIGRYGRLRKPVERFATIANVDHHVSNPRYGHINVVLPEAAATGEVVYDLFRHFGVPIDAEAALGMYVALVTDTGGFAYEATSAESHLMAADLIRSGVRPAEVSRALYEQVSPEELAISALAVTRMRRSADGRIAWTCVTREMLQETGADEEHTEGIVETLRAMRGVEVSFFVREQADGLLKASFRSKSGMDVSRLAGRFSGGGHRRAAGATLTGTLDEAVARILEAIAHEFQATR